MSKRRFLQKLGNLIRMIKVLRVRLVTNEFKRAKKIRKLNLLHRVGRGCYLGSAVSFGGEPELISLGNNVWITSGVRFITHDGSVFMLHKSLKKKLNLKIGEIIIKDNSFIGVNSILLPGITIGPNSIVGAGSVVTKDVPPGVIVAGNPAREITSVERYLSKMESYDFQDALKKIRPHRRKRLLQLVGRR